MKIRLPSASFLSLGLLLGLVVGSTGGRAAPAPPLGPTLKVVQGASSVPNTKVLNITAGCTLTPNGTEADLACGGGGGAVTSVTASAPIASSGGATPNISLTGVVPIANGGTNSLTALANGFAMISASGKIVEAISATATAIVQLVDSPDVAFQGSSWEVGAAVPIKFAWRAHPVFTGIYDAALELNGTEVFGLILNQPAGLLILEPSVGLQPFFPSGVSDPTVLAMQFDTGTTYSGVAQPIYEFNNNGNPLLGIADDGAGATKFINLSPKNLRFLGGVGGAGAGAVTLTGARVGDAVVGVVATSIAPGTVSTNFETVITVNDQIQQTGGLLNGHGLAVQLIANN